MKQKYVKPSIRVRIIDSETVMAGSPPPSGGDQTPPSGPAKASIFDNRYDVDQSSDSRIKNIFDE